MGKPIRDGLTKCSGMDKDEGGFVNWLEKGIDTQNDMEQILAWNMQLEWQHKTDWNF